MSETFDTDDDGVSIGELPRAVSLNAGDIVPVSQDYTVPGTGITRGATIGQIQEQALNRTVAMSIVGQPAGGQTYQVVFASTGTLNVAGYGHALTNPAAINDFTVQTINSGTIHVKGTIAISTGGAFTFPTGTSVMAAGDVLEIVNQGTADTTGSDYGFAFPFVG